jgi:asparagine synthase (glutamine-hydrolysing)
MIAPITHRGPDDSGVWVDAANGLALGFRRLAILDLSPLGHQPMESASGRFIAAFNGEIYNFRDLRAILEPHGYTFRGQSDTEVMLAAFEHWGIAGAIRRFVGMYAIAVWDTVDRRLTLIRDRLGKKPLYVYQEAGLISFGSELKALVAGPSFDRTIDRTALTSYLQYLYVPAPRSIFQHATKIPAGHLLQITDAHEPLPATEPYWSLETAAREGLARPFIGDDREAVDELERMLSDAVACRLGADVPLGALLSGGIDSSTIVALMQRESARRVKTFTIGFAEKEFDEDRHAAQVAAHIGTDHTALRLTGDDAMSLVPHLTEIFDEPLADPSELPTLLVSRLARTEVTVALCGDGGDELFGGYNRYVYGMRVVPRALRIPKSVRESVGAGLGRVPASAWNRLSPMAAMFPSAPLARLGERVHKLGRVLLAPSSGHMYRSLLSAWPRPEELLTAEARHELMAPDDANARVFETHAPAHLLDQMMLADQLTYLPDDLLAKVDRASMAVSLEVRAPILDHHVVEFSWRLPREMKVRGAMGKWALRQVLYRHVPRHLVDRPKMGFSVPIDRWLRGPLRSWAESLLPGISGKPDTLLDGTTISRAWHDLLERRRPVGAALWAVVMLQAWRARWAA